MMNHRSLAAVLGSLFAATAAAQWTATSPATSPSARRAAAMACNPISDACVLFGGFFNPGGQSLGWFLNETWTYDGTNWTQIAAVNQPSSATSPKYYSRMVYDFARDRYVLFGGATNINLGLSNETWEFNANTSTWTQLTPAQSPSPRYLHDMVYDPLRDRIVLYGGSPGFGNTFTDTWEFDGTNWIQRFPAHTPGRLEGHSMCFHVSEGVTVLFGGADQLSNPAYRDKTWAWNGTDWTELTISGTKPLLRERGCMAHDTVRNASVLVGGMRAAGQGSGPKPNDTWELKKTGATTWTWTEVIGTSAPQPVPGGNPVTFFRFESTLAFLPNSRRMVQFGGYDEFPDVPVKTYYADTTDYGATSSKFGSGCPGANGTPAITAAGPHLGESWTVDVANLHPAFNLSILVFGFTQLPGVDLGPIIDMPGCLLWLSAEILIAAPTGAGGTTNWTWTTVTGSLGDRFYAQALCLDPAANNFGFTISDALAATIGL